jgi:hypothetical protein
MLRVFAAVLMAVGFGLAVAGCYAFSWALRLGIDTTVTVLESVWAAPEYAFLAALLSSVGCGLFVLGLTWFVALGRAAPGRVWRPLLWALLAAAVTGTLTAFGAYRATGRGPLVPPLAEAESLRAANVADDYIDTLDRKWVTDDFRRRLEARGDQTSYYGRYARNSQIVSAEEIRITATMYASQKKVRRTSPRGVTEETFTFPERRPVFLTLRLRKTPEGAWLVDDLEFKE